MITIKQPPKELLEALDRWRGEYTDPVTLFQIVHWPYGQWFGVFGDGSHGAYEWFEWSESGGLLTSDVGYGQTDGAFVEILIRQAALTEALTEKTKQPSLAGEKR